MTSPPFCPGYPPPFDVLVASFPGSAVYSQDAFRFEWGPIFHRGRLDGTAQVLILGQDPAVHETVTRRILVGVAGQRVQGLLTRLGLTRSYVMVNTFLYSVFGQSGGTGHIHDPGITTYRNQWLTTLTATSPVTAVITLGTLAADAFAQWQQTPAGAAYTGHHAALLHPTFPESASSHGQKARSPQRPRNCSRTGTPLCRPSEPRSPNRTSHKTAARLRQNLHRRRPSRHPVGRPPARTAGVDAQRTKLGHPHRHEQRHQTRHDPDHRAALRPGRHTLVIAADRPDRGGRPIDLPGSSVVAARSARWSARQDRSQGRATRSTTT